MMDRRNFSNMEELTCTIAELIPYDTGGHAINVGEKIKENYKYKNSRTRTVLRPHDLARSILRE